jgi:hypothetical protein
VVLILADLVLAAVVGAQMAVLRDQMEVLTPAAQVDYMAGVADLLQATHQVRVLVQEAQ